LSSRAIRRGIALLRIKGPHSGRPRSLALLGMTNSDDPPVLVVLLILQCYYIEGVMAGSVRE